MNLSGRPRIVHARNRKGQPEDSAPHTVHLGHPKSVEMDRGKWNEPVEVGDLRVTFREAGHILGASSVVVDDGSRRVLFSGDLGRENDLDFTASLGLMLKAVLVSPQFLFIE